MKLYTLYGNSTKSLHILSKSSETFYKSATSYITLDNLTSLGLCFLCNKLSRGASVLIFHETNIMGGGNLCFFVFFNVFFFIWAKTSNFFFFKFCPQRKTEIQRKGIPCWLNCSQISAEMHIVDGKVVPPLRHVDSPMGYCGFDKRLNLAEIR